MVKVSCFRAINNLLFSAPFVGYAVGYCAVIALISVSLFTGVCDKGF